ncbi:MAG: indolepyruvate ferredoxin oxidoreductase subunit alpha [Candidatus Odinarchaeota archaeon]|nr:indolepyruvate ferredoxin oxidoreductase subunit alpha [Candidatus Odinarchaeota archaeon]
MSKLTEKLVNTKPGESVFLLGNEAIARGAIEAGIGVASTYPGTPSSEIGDTLFTLSQFFDYYFEYSTNEKVALEVAATAAISNVRSLVCMKQVGLNVAADPFMTLAYVGVNGGMIIVSADDPFAHSSQNEQDNRNYARFAGIPMLEPSNPQEAKDFVKIGMDVSEKTKEPVILRTTTRVNHMSGKVILGEVIPHSKPHFEKNLKRYVTVPSVARIRHKVLLENLEKAKKISEEIAINRIIGSGDNKFGIITSGISINYVLDAFHMLKINSVDVLALGMTYPLPENKITDFLSSHEKVLIVEELEPFIEDQVKRIAFDKGIDVKIYGKYDNFLPRLYEFDANIVSKAIEKAFNVSGSHIDFEKRRKISEKLASLIPPRPPVLCPGCPHRGTYFAIKQAVKKKNVEPIYSTDIGCYTLGIQDPMNIGDLLLCMGSSIGTAGGFSATFNKLEKEKKKIFALIGDSTFFHTGIPGMVNAIYNRHDVTFVVMDNLSTAMTGHQPHPGIKIDTPKKKTKPIKIEDVVNGVGADYVKVVNPFIISQTTKAFEEAIEKEGLSVVIAKGECALTADRRKRKEGKKIIPFEIDYEKCTLCRVCVDEVGCPAIMWLDNKPVISPLLCDGCSVCAQACPEHAIRRGKQ